MPRTVLIMTYEFPPSGGGGVQRIAKLARYLPLSGWRPVVVAAEPIQGRPLDPSLAEEVADVRVVRVPARHVSTAISRAIAPAKALARRVRGADAGAGGSTASGSAASGAARSASARSSLSLRLSRWIATPDDAAFWIAPAVEAGVKLGAEMHADAVFASGPPFSALVAGARVAKRLGVPLVTDIRDGWASNPLLRYPTRGRRDRALALEREALSASSATIATAPAIAEEAAGLGARDVRLVPNGFDSADLPAPSRDAAGPLRLAFMGRVYPGLTDPAPLVDAMTRVSRDAAADDPAAAIEFDLVGTWPESLPARIAASGAEQRIRLHTYRPHADALELVSRADVGVAVVADTGSSQGATPAKLFEYLGMGMPVLLLAPADGFPAHILAETRGGIQVAPDDADALDAALRRLAAEKAAGTLAPPDAAAVAHYERRAQAEQIAAVLDTAAGAHASAGTAPSDPGAAE